MIFFEAQTTNQFGPRHPFVFDQSASPRPGSTSRVQFASPDSFCQTLLLIMAGHFLIPPWLIARVNGLRHSLPSTGMSLSAPYIGTVAAPFSVPYSHLPSFVPSIPGIPGIPGISSLNSFVPSYGFGRAFTPYQYMGGRYWGNSYGLNRGGIPSSGRLSSVQVIQTAPSKASGNYYSAPTTDSSASGSYYAGSHNNSYFGNTSIYNSGVYSSRRSLNNSSETNWGASGNPFPKDLNSTPWVIQIDR
jgi:hypothetical protein